MALHHEDFAISVTKRVKDYMIAFLVMDTLMVGTFCALDLVLFYIFFEGILIPMYLIIGIWGGPRRIYSAFKFFLYTLLGSVLFLVAIITIYVTAGTTEMNLCPGVDNQRVMSNPREPDDP